MRIDRATNPNKHANWALRSAYVQFALRLDLLHGK
jgi:hypothetical protein